MQYFFIKYRYIYIERFGNIDGVDLSGLDIDIFMDSFIELYMDIQSQGYLRV